MPIAHLHPLKRLGLALALTLTTFSAQAGLTIQTWTTPAGSKVDEYGCSLAARLEVHFDTASAVLKPESYADLDAVAKFMTDVPRVAGVLEGHTDSVGNDKSNERLSQRRAESVKAYLVSKGIDPARLQTQGFGESQPEADNATAEGRAKNRRVELVKQ